MFQPILDHAVLTGEHVVLRPVKPRDADAAFRILYDRQEVLDWLIWSGPESREEMQRYYEHWRIESDGGANYHFAMEERESGAFCGTLGLRFLGHAFTGDLGYWVAPEHWNRGIGTEALGLIGWLSFQRLEAALLFARVFVGNEASGRILVKNGFQLDQVASLEVRGERRQLQHWSITTSSWREHNAGFQPVCADVTMQERNGLGGGA